MSFPHLPRAALLLLLAACTPQKPETKPEPVRVPSETRAAPAAPQAAPRPPAASRVFDESLLRGHEYLLEAPSSVTMVRDADLGALETNSAIVDVVQAFFQAVVDGKPEGGLAPRWADYLKNWALRFQGGKTGPFTVRTGQSIVQEGGTLVPVRLTWQAKTFSGWVVLVTDKESYLVSDVQIGESAPRAGPIDPESPQEISSPSLR